MATKPVTCPYDEGEGFKFYRGNLVLDDGKSMYPPIYMELSDLLMESTSFSKSSINLRSGKCFLLSQNDIANDLGYVSFILVKAIFPQNTLETRKYLEWTYMERTYYMGELMALSGKMLSSTDSLYEGWMLAKPNQYSDRGGIIFCNNQSELDIKLEILICK